MLVPALLLLCLQALAAPATLQEIQGLVTKARQDDLNRVIRLAAVGVDAEKALRAIARDNSLEISRISHLLPMAQEMATVRGTSKADCVLGVSALKQAYWEVLALGTCGAVPSSFMVQDPKGDVPAKDSVLSELSALGFSRLVFRIPTGSVVGTRSAATTWTAATGFSNGSPAMTYTWGENFSVSGAGQGVLILEELRKIGFNVLGAEDPVFGKDRSAEARFVLGGLVDGFSYEGKKSLSGTHTVATMNLEWQVLDRDLDKVVFTRRAVGRAESSELLNPDGMLDRCVVQALADLPSDKALLKLLAPSKGSIEASGPLLIQPCLTPPRRLPADLPRTMEAVLVLRNGALTGTAVVISPEGYAVTADHLLGQGNPEILLSSGIAVQVQVARRDKEHDVALLKIPGRDMACVPLSNVDPPIGASVFAMGVPVGKELSVTRGIVSGIRRYEGGHLLQTDAGINPGNSGGPLLDEQGLLIGVISFKIVGVGLEGLGFGVPSQVVQERLGLSFDQTD